jgi:hypothetical protein
MLLSLAGCTKKTNSDNGIVVENEKGKLLLKVVDKTTKKPLANAKIRILGITDTYKTDDKGLSPVINIYINRDYFKRYGEDLQKKAPSGTVTVIVSMDGYKEYISFNKPIYPGYTANNMTVEMTKPAKSDKQNYFAEACLPHEAWVQELVTYCASIKDINAGKGLNRVTVSVKNNNTKSIEGVMVFIPELGIKGMTDKNGKCVLNLDNFRDDRAIYPVKRQFSDYTIIAMKQDYATNVIFNAAVEDGKESLVSIKLSTSKSQDDITISHRPYEKEWIEKLITSYKE